MTSKATIPMSMSGKSKMTMIITAIMQLQRIINFGVKIMENKITALEELVNSEIRIYKKNCIEIDEDVLQQNIWMAVESYYETDQIPTKEELEYLNKLELNFTEFAAHYEVITLDAPNGEICTVDSTCDPEEALKWYNEEINGFVYIQLVDHDSMLIEVLKCNF